MVTSPSAASGVLEISTSIGCHASSLSSNTSYCVRATMDVRYVCTVVAFRALQVVLHVSTHALKGKQQYTETHSTARTYPVHPVLATHSMHQCSM